MAVVAEEVGERVLGEAEPVVHTEPVRRRPLRLVEGDLVADPRQECPDSRGEVRAWLGNLPALVCGKRVPRRLDQPSASR